MDIARRSSVSDSFTRPPRENLYRALQDCPELVRSDGEPMPTMVGHFAVFNEWTEIASRYEGHFLERFAPGSFAKTISENRDRMRVLFQHGQDPHVGNKVLGPITQLDEDARGTRYEVPLLDTSYNRDLLPGLEAGLYGASFRFSVLVEDIDRRPRASEHNPDGLPERTVREARVREFGPVTFPAYVGASAGLRSITDEMLLERLVGGDEPKGNATISVPRAVEIDREEEARSERLFERSVSRVSSTPWAIHVDTLATILAIIGERASGHKPSAEEIQERIGTRAQPAGGVAAGPVAVIPLCGPIVPHAPLMGDVSGGGVQSVEEFQGAFRQALANPDVHSILIDVDSPGGDVSLVPELAAEIRAARGQKPIVAVANTFAASAAYWIASAADEVVVSPSGQVGSIGVYSAHDDMSAMQEKLGVKTTLVSAGKYKVERNPFGPLSEAAQAEMQSKVDEYYGMFLQAVADGRGTDVATVRDKFGQGRMVLPSKALAAGMVDAIATYDETLARMSADAQAAAVAADPEPEPSAATTPDRSEPEPSEATTRAPKRDLIWFAQTQNEGAQ
jgi:HK97 family phage prohead protease